MNIKKIALLIIFLLSSLSYCLAHDEDKSHYAYLQDPNDLINPNDFYEYQIIKNDYLSFLAVRFYNDKWKWTKIYEANPYIIDPNWIYPDNWLVIPDIYSDKNGNPITKQRSFTYKSNDTVILNSVTKSTIVQQDSLYPKDKSGNSPEHQNNGEDIDETVLFKTEKPNIENESGIGEQLKEDFDDTTKITIKPSIATTYDNDNNTIKVTDQIPAKNLTIKSRIDPTEEAVAKSSYNTNPNWVIGLHGGYPFGDVPNKDDDLVFGLLIGTPLRITLGSINARLGAGFLGYNFTGKIYPGAGLLLSFAINELLRWSTPIQLQFHGTGFYVPDGGVGTGIFASTSVPIADSPFNIGLYLGIGKLNTGESTNSTWKNTGLFLQLQL